MIETIKYATISNIYVKELIFYDRKNEDKLKTMCINYGITFLPSADRKSCYKLTNNGTFELSELSDDLICNPYDRIFEDDTISKFEKGNHDEVMFVLEDGKIKGVVHIVDYNTEFINYEFYKATYRLEKMLRELLIKKGETNETLLDWMLQKSIKSKFWSDRYSQCVPLNEDYRKEQDKKRKECNPFQTFFFNDLLMFAASKKYVSNNFKRNIENLKEIRNWVAHNKDLTPRNREETHPLYRIDGLKKFVNGARNFFNCYEELEELTR